MNLNLNFNSRTISYFKCSFDLLETNNRLIILINHQIQLIFINLILAIIKKEIPSMIIYLLI